MPSIAVHWEGPRAGGDGDELVERGADALSRSRSGGPDPTGLLLREPRPVATMRGPTPPAIRRFSIGDLMIIVAGTALGCAWTRANWYAPGAGAADDAWETAVQLPTPLLFSLGIAALICRFAPPRPPWGQIARQPGVVALAILAFVMAMNAAIMFAGVAARFATSDLPARALHDAPFLLPDAAELYVYQVVAAGPSVIVCWGLQSALGWWEPERSWIDRTGRALGIALILVEVAGVLAWLGRQP